ncbi:MULTISPECIES: hypothetical protein [Shewanella]|uniref:hypothetical protein n=1 Tax=Shewanella TaxID=22 RepID=UPI00285F059E|nr:MULTISPECIES: hypothetical protein [Shewanella]MDR6965748.1 hypothetical protein [Shewanella putrefaciens]WVI93409.1 hypothetical protein VR487_21795 [Shewanella oncorhynchi]
MDIIFLDQNKWIDLAGVEAGKASSPQLVALYNELIAAVESGRAIFPLTVSHILETSKRNDPTSRGHVATAQARLSKGYVFRSRKTRLLIEMRVALQQLFDETSLALSDNWVVAPGFMQAFEVFDEMVASTPEAQHTRWLNKYLDPREQFLDYMLNQDDSARRAAHVAFAAESAALVERIEKRRGLLEGESGDLRKRAYSAKLFLDHQGYVAHVLQSLGHTVDEMKAKGPKAIASFLENVPTLNIEAEMAVKLEAQSRAIEENDIRDMLSFNTALPYASSIVGEKRFVSLAKQANLDKKYGTSISKSLDSLLGVYSAK